MLLIGEGDQGGEVERFWYSLYLLEYNYLNTTLGGGD